LGGAIYRPFRVAAQSAVPFYTTCLSVWD
jgi:hypothetical protein